MQSVETRLLYLSHGKVRNDFMFASWMKQMLWR